MFTTSDKIIGKSIRQHLLTFVVLLLFLGASFLPVWEGLGIYPHFFILIYFHWLLYRPDLITLPHLLILAFIRDGLLGHLLGMSMIHFLVLYFVVYTQRRFFVYQSFPMVFLAFSVFAGIDSFVSWALLSYMYQTYVAYYAFGVGAIILILLYPLTSVISTLLQKRYLKI